MWQQTHACCTKFKSYTAKQTMKSLPSTPVPTTQFSEALYTFCIHGTYMVFLVCVDCYANGTELCSFHITHLRNRCLPLSLTLPHSPNNYNSLRACTINYFTSALPADTKVLLRFCYHKQRCSEHPYR